MQYATTYSGGVDLGLMSLYHNKSFISNRFSDVIQTAKNTVQKRNSEYYFAHVKSIINKMSKASYIKSISESEFYYANDSFYNLIGFDLEKGIKDLTDEDLTSSICDDGLKNLLGAIQQNEEQAVLTNQNIINQKLQLYQNAEGFLVQYHLNVILIRDDRNNVIGVLSQLADTTEKINHELLFDMYSKYHTQKRLAIKYFIDHIGLSEAFCNLKTSLTKRELECLIHLSKGKTAKETAKELCASPRTVETHLENIKEKFNTTKKAEALCIFMRYYKVEMGDRK